MFLPTASSRASARAAGPRTSTATTAELRRRLRAHRGQNPTACCRAPRRAARVSDHHFFKLERPALRRPSHGPSWTHGRRPPAARGAEQDQGNVRPDEEGKPPGKLGHQPRRALLRHRDPRRAGQVLLRLAGRPGRLPRSLAAHFAKTGATWTPSGRPATEQVHFIGKDITYFHTLFWPAMLHFSGRKTPDQVYVHGFLTVKEEKMRARARHWHRPQPLPRTRPEAEWLRYYLAAKLNDRVEDLDFNPRDFIRRVNSDLVGKYINIASRAAGFDQTFWMVSWLRPRRRGEVVIARLRRRDQPGWFVRQPRVRQGGPRGDGAGRCGQRVVDAHKPWELAKAG